MSSLDSSRGAMKKGPLVIGTRDLGDETLRSLLGMTCDKISVV